jgi:NAD(P)-dependent dehydrogenase (short-subunit alcohol dehydrogenase family)
MTLPPSRREGGIFGRICRPQHPRPWEGAKRFLEDAARTQGTNREELRKDYFIDGDGASSLLARFAEPREIAAQVVFLCSPHAATVNGAAQRVDGGIIRSMP